MDRPRVRPGINPARRADPTLIIQGLMIQGLMIQGLMIQG
ncbi:hypothetical protein BXY39_2124 [Eilatimonas milleporae]|uniref:Uncharacterized protein n=1 Tax=Eilatimonas milleporae TaxID=911205 RepID=A0A3M0CLU5_9PROT|nr:hypothetical protein BXY39_2124 [Eilatimonas milleporae]